MTPADGCADAAPAADVGCHAGRRANAGRYVDADSETYVNRALGGTAT